MAHDGDFCPVQALADVPRALFGEFEDMHLHALVVLARGLNEMVRFRDSMTRGMADWIACIEVVLIIHPPGPKHMNATPWGVFSSQ